MQSLHQAYFVHIVESPSSADLLDGRTEGRVLSEALNLSTIQSCYNLVTDHTTFKASLTSRLAIAINHMGAINRMGANRSLSIGIPILHLSMHGNENGIALTNKDFISWSELGQMLLPINHRLEGGLIICLSSCFGGFGSIMAMHENQSIPFFALIGHTNSALWTDAAIGFVTFYHHLLNKNSYIEEAVEAMKKASGDDRFVASYGEDAQMHWINYMQNQRNRSLGLARQRLRRRTRFNGST